jgi:hypothetical protein
MKIYVGVTEHQWFDYLRQPKGQSPEYLDKINIWQPSPDVRFKAFGKGDLFLV